MNTTHSMNDSGNCPAAILADYVSAARFEQIPAHVIAWATALVEDNLGCALGALTLSEASAILAVAQVDVGATSALAIGGPLTSVRAAVFCNSQLSNLLDFDDMHDYFMPYHPGCLVVPSALAVAQAIGASGRDFLTAVVVAYEVAMRVGRGMGNGLWSALPSTAALDELAAAIATAKLYELDPARIRALFSIIAMDEGGFPLQRAQSDLPASARLGNLKGNFGSRAEAGVSAAMKARAGLAGMTGMLEWTLADWYRAGLPIVGYEGLAAQLGHEYLCLKMSLKPVPSCRMSHVPITAAREALGSRTLDAQHVARIRIVGIPRLQRTQWSSMVDAQFSIPCTLALAISGIEPGPKWYADDAFRSSPILDLAAKVEQEADPEAERIEILEGRPTCRLDIQMKDGRTLHGECRVVKGNPDNPLTLEERRAKFAANTAHLPDRGREVAMALERLAHTSAVTELSAALAAGSRSSSPN
jgi:2-methylcitrate dehydratase PrpD